MRLRPAIPDGPYLVVGLARSGLAAARALCERGARVIGVDSGVPAAGGAELERLRALGVELHGESDGLAHLERAGAVVKSPGVPARAPVIAAARQRGLPVLGELELAWRLLENELIAVTGTNGKTTTVELIGHIHREAGRPVAVAGNVGAALSGLVGRVERDAVVVCEASSFQLEDTLAFAPEAAVLLNITPDHLDRHGSMEAYRQAKLRVFAHQARGDVAVLPLEMLAPTIEVTSAVTRPGVRLVSFGEDSRADCSLHDGTLSWGGEPLLRLDELRLRGAHNARNALAAAAVCLARGVEPDAVRAGLGSFAGVAHRLQDVARRAGVLYVNDSKATNVASTLVALAAFEKAGGGAQAPRGNVHLILGGRGKSQDFTPLAAPAARTCRAVYLIGEDASSIALALSDSGLPLHESGTLESAVSAAAAAAVAGDVVLLSPACASFDQFSDFEARGARFAELVGGD